MHYIRSTFLALFLLSVSVFAGPSEMPKGSVHTPMKYSEKELALCAEYMVLLGQGGRSYDDVVRNPHPDDTLNWLIGVGPDGRAYYVVGAQPALSAHKNMMGIIASAYEDETDERITFVAAGETKGDKSVQNNFAGIVEERKYPKNSNEEALALLKESPIGRKLIPEKVELRDYKQGHLNPKTKSRGHKGHFTSLFHDARNGMSAVVGYMQLLGFSTPEELAKDGMEVPSSPKNINPIIKLINTQDFGRGLPAGLQQTKDLLLKLKHEGAGGHYPLSEVETKTLLANLNAIVAALSNQPFEVYYLGRAEKGADGHYHIVKEDQGKAPEVIPQYPLAPDPEKVELRDYKEGDLGPESKSRVQKGHFTSLFHDARNGMSAVVGYTQLLGFSTPEELAKGGLEVPSSPKNINPIIKLINTQDFGRGLPPGLQETRDLLLKLKHEGAVGRYPLSEVETKTLLANLNAIVASLSNQPVEVHYLGLAEKGVDGDYHIVKEDQGKAPEVIYEYPLPPDPGTLQLPIRYVEGRKY